MDSVLHTPHTRLTFTPTSAVSLLQLQAYEHEIHSLTHTYSMLEQALAAKDKVPSPLPLPSVTATAIP